MLLMNILADAWDIIDDSLFLMVRGRRRSGARAAVRGFATRRLIWELALCWEIAFTYLYVCVISHNYKPPLHVFHVWYDFTIDKLLSLKSRPVAEPWEQSVL